METSSTQNSVVNNETLYSAIDRDEREPQTLYYRTMSRLRVKPSLIRLGLVEDDNVVNSKYEKHSSEEKNYKKFGTFNGVFIRCVLSILSAVYYLRLGWVVGNCGLVYALVIIGVTCVATILTTLSLSAVVTNGQVKGGGVYYFISRSLGSDWGGTVGIVFTFATTFGTVLHVFSFVEVVQSFNNGPITKDGKYDYPLIGISLTLFLLIVISISLKLEVVMEYILSAMIILAMIAFFFNPCYNTSKYKYSVENIIDNLWPSYLPGHNFWSVFAVFFPGCTGIMAGANISGDLEDPQRSIPIGTLGAIVFTSLLNMVTAVILASAGDRDTLKNNYDFMSELSLWGPLINMGVIGAAVSSASACMIGAPKTFQSLCQDKLLPKIFDFFSVGKKTTNDPVRGFCLVFCIVFICCFIFHDLNTVGKILTNFFLISFALICLSSFIGSMSRSPAWRPSWKYHHIVLDMLGAGILIAGMIAINWILSLITLVICLILFSFFHFRIDNNNWGDFPQSLLITDAVSKIEKLNRMPEHVKTYRPEIEYLIIYDNETIERQRDCAFPFVQIIDSSYSIMSLSVIGSSIPDDFETIGKSYIHKWGDIRPDTVCRLISSCVGYGRLSPNIIAVPLFKDDTFFDIVAAAVDADMGVLISNNFVKDTVYSGYIDIWWLFDDGGLTLLIGYLLCKSDPYKKCCLRCISINNPHNVVDDTQMRLAKILHLLRIPAEIIVVAGIDKPPNNQTLSEWQSYDNVIDDQFSQSDFIRLIRIKELIKETSSESTTIICSMPLPKISWKKKTWVSLLDFISSNLPPFIWVHGNNENVVTFLA